MQTSVGGTHVLSLWMTNPFKKGSTQSSVYAVTILHKSATLGDCSHLKQALLALMSGLTVPCILWLIPLPSPVP